MRATASSRSPPGRPLTPIPPSMAPSLGRRMTTPPPTAARLGSPKSVYAARLALEPVHICLGVHTTHGAGIGFFHRQPLGEFSTAVHLSIANDVTGIVHDGYGYGAARGPWRSLQAWPSSLPVPGPNSTWACRTFSLPSVSQFLAPILYCLLEAGTRRALGIAWQAP